MVKYLLLVVAIASVAAQGRPKYGVFSNPDCGAVMEGFTADKIQEYEDRARTAGYTNQIHIDEYVERAKRTRYLVFKSGMELNEQETISALLNRAIEKNLFLEPVSKRVRMLMEIGAELSAEWIGDGLVQDTHPFLVQTLVLYPPKNLARVDRLLRIFTYRTWLSVARAETSMAFSTELSCNTTVQKQPRDKVLELLEREDRPWVKQLHEDRAIAFKDEPSWNAWFERRRLMFALNPNRPADPKFSKIAQLLLESEKVPDAVKNEIDQELDFREKYGAVPTPVFEVFLLELEVYFLR